MKGIILAGRRERYASFPLDNCHQQAALTGVR